MILIFCSDSVRFLFFPHILPASSRDINPRRLQFRSQDVTESAAELELLEGKIAPDVQGKKVRRWQVGVVFKKVCLKSHLHVYTIWCSTQIILYIYNIYKYKSI